MTVLYHKRRTVLSIFPIRISQNAKCANKTGFEISQTWSHSMHAGVNNYDTDISCVLKIYLVMHMVDSHVNILGFLLHSFKEIYSHKAKPNKLNALLF